MDVFIIGEAYWRGLSLYADSICCARLRRKRGDLKTTLPFVGPSF